MRGLVRQIHRQKQESAVLWQHSPTQGSTDSFRTNAVDAWDLAMPGQVRQYPSPPGYQSDEYGIRPPFGLSPPPGLALKYATLRVSRNARFLILFMQWSCERSAWSGHHKA